MEFRVLGPVEVLDAGRRIELGGRKQRTVLALLVANTGRPVTTDRLIEEAYGDEAPDGARRSVQTFVSNLRSRIGHQITSVPSGYEFNPGDSVVDAAEFTAMVESGRSRLDEDPAEAGAQLRGALALWQGHPYADVEARTELDAEITRLSELRLVAIESRIDADLATGKDRELVGELEALTTEHPFREAFHGQYMLALYRAGRQADSLRAFTRVRELLADELGVDPSPALRELEQRILEQDPGLQLAAPSAVRRRAVVVIDLRETSLEPISEPHERRRILTDLDDVVNVSIDESEGAVAAQQGTATYSTFADIGRAISAAARIAVESPRTGGAPIASIAIDIGDVEEDAAGGIAGPAVIRAAGLVAAAHPGQVLLSAEAQAAAATDSAGGAVLRVLGRHTIARLEEPETVHQLIVDGLPGAYPDLLSGAEPPELPGGPVAAPGYEIREEIGRGLFGTVYRGYQPSIGREVAIKVINPELANSSGFIRRFAVEAQMVSRIEHPNIVPLYDFWRAPDGALLVMRLLRGGDLADLHALHSLARPEALRLVDQVGGALATAHAVGIAHGDVQVRNVLLNDSGDFFLSDFGIAVEASTLRRGGLQQLDVASLAAMVSSVAANDALTEAEQSLLGAAQAGEYDTASSWLEAWRREVGVPDSSATYTPTRNPYKGLAAFSELDAQDFHGRDAVVAELVAAVAGSRLTAAVGPSGVGKSSVVRAGLLPALRAGAVSGSEQWLIADCMPGSHPFERLASSLIRVASTGPGDLESLLQSDDRGLIKAVDRYLPPAADLLLVVDQFEELFTLTTDNDERDAFMQLLATAVSDRASRIQVLITVRADFFDRPLRHAEFGELLRAGTVPVSAPTEAELREIIVKPAAGVGVDFEPGLVDRMSRDVQDEAGVLPLLEFALTQLFEQRDSDVLTLAAYQASGGVAAALGRRAEEVFDSMEPPAQGTTRQLFMRLVTPGEGGRDTRHRVRVSELNRLGLEANTVRGVLAAFGEARLLTFDLDDVSRSATVELAHEALLREWPRLKAWIDSHREELVLRGRLDAAVADWEAAERSGDYLLRGGRLTQHEAWVETTGLPLSSAERELLHESRAAEDRRASTNRRRRRVLTGALVGAVAVTTALAAFGFVQRNSAREGELIARARELALTAREQIAEDPERAVLLAIEAIRTGQQAGRELPEAVNALRAAAAQDRVVARHDGSEFVAVDPAGRIALTARDSGAVAFDLATGEAVITIPAIGDEFALDGAFGGGEVAVVFGSSSGGRLVVADVATGVARIEEQLAGLPYQVSWRSNRIAVGWLDAASFGPADRGLEVRDAATGEVEFVFPSTGRFDIDAGASRLAIGNDAEGTIGIYDLDSGELITTIAPPSGAEAVAFSPSGDAIATVKEVDSRAVVLDASTGEVRTSIAVDRPFDVSWTLDGAELIIVGASGVPVIADATSGDVRLRLQGQQGSLWSSAQIADTSQILTTGTPGIVMWEIGTDAAVGTVATWATSFGSLASINYISEGVELFVAERFGAGGMAVLDAASGSILREAGGVAWSREPDRIIGMSADGQYFTHASETGGGVVVDPQSLETVFTAPAGRQVAAVSFDGSLGLLVTFEPGAVPGSPQVVELGSGNVVASIDASFVCGADFSRDGALVRIWDCLGAGHSSFFDVAGGRELENMAYAGSWTRFMPGGESVLTVSDEGTLRLSDLDALREGASYEDATIWEVAAHDTFVPTVVHNADGSVILTGAREEPIRIWDGATGALIAEIANPLPFGSPRAALHPTMPEVLVSAPNGAIQAHTLDVAELIALAEAALSRSLSDLECQTYLRLNDCGGVASG